MTELVPSVPWFCYSVKAMQWCQGGPSGLCLVYNIVESSNQSASAIIVRIGVDSILWISADLSFQDFCGPDLPVSSRYGPNEWWRHLSVLRSPVYRFILACTGCVLIQFWQSVMMLFQARRSRSLSVMIRRWLTYSLYSFKSPGSDVLGAEEVKWVGCDCSKTGFEVLSRRNISSCICIFCTSVCIWILYVSSSILFVSSSVCILFVSCSVSIRFVNSRS